MIKTSNRRMLTITEVADMLHLHSNTVRRWSNLGILKSYRFGSRGDRRFMMDDILRFQNMHQSNKEYI